MSDNKLPTFRKPPVIETVLGVQFDPVPGFTNAHLGAYWKWLLAHAKPPLDTQWTTLTDAPAVEPAFERFDEQQSWLLHNLNKMRVGPPTPTRLQIRNPHVGAMIQVQNTRLIYNWIGKPGKGYSRYASIRPMFDNAYKTFCGFLDAERLEKPKENQWEVTYVNHIPKGTVWQVPEDWPGLFVGLPGPWAGLPGVELEYMNGSWHYEIPPQRGRLHIELKLAVSQGERPIEALRLTLTARGPAGEAGISLSEGLDLGRETIVLAFKNMTSPEAHRTWELVE